MLPLRFEPELTAQELEIWRLWGLSKEFGLSATTPPLSAPDVKSLMSSPVSWRAVALDTRAEVSVAPAKSHDPLFGTGITLSLFSTPVGQPSLR
jgi:hypothetical protein